ncbi:DNA primase [Salmonella enterica subsp. enterica serovar Agbeni]|nr:DNA primase [Salmonella enterica subsp. enterica serovar Agbeni]
MKTQEAVKGRWADVFKVFGLPPITGKKAFKGECPICKRRGKFRIDDKDGTGSFICVCNVGDGWALLNLTQKKSFKELAADVDRIIGNTWQAGPKPEKTDAQRHRERVIKKMPSLVGLKGTDGEKYLVSRGINVLPTDGVRFCTTQRVNGEICQALYALASDSRGELCYLHRTLLKDGRKYTKWGAAKKMLRLQEETYIEHASSVAIRLFPVASTLGIAEGIETALAAYQISHCHTWATQNTTFMRRFVAPSGVNHLIIFADSDNSAAGHAAAFECAFKNLNRKDNDLETVAVRWPEAGDFNDVLTTGARVFEWIFRRK